jgi:hypothetical protein
LLAKLGAVLNRPEGSGFAVVSPFAMYPSFLFMPPDKPMAFAGKRCRPALVGISPL